MSKDIHQLLTLEDKGISKGKDTLAIMFRTILADLFITSNKWDRLITKFVESVSDNRVKQSSDRSNINRSLQKDNFQGSWRTFRRGLEVLNPKEIEYVITPYWENGIVYPVKLPEHISHKSYSNNDLFAITSQLWTKLEIRPKIWDRLIDRYLRNVVQIEEGSYDRIPERGNLNKSIIESKSYTWEKFCRAIRILCFQSMDF